MRARTNAGNVYILPAGAFADFRLDGPPGIDIVFDEGGGLESIEHNNRIYVRMMENWYIQFSRELNYLPLPDIEHNDFERYLCFRILRGAPSDDPIDRRDFPLIRAAMDLPRIAQLSPNALKRAISALMMDIRSRNAAALREGGGRGGIRAACAMIIFAADTGDASAVF